MAHFKGSNCLLEFSKISKMSSMCSSWMWVTNLQKSRQPIRSFKEYSQAVWQCCQRVLLNSIVSVFPPAIWCVGALVRWCVGASWEKKVLTLNGKPKRTEKKQYKNVGCFHFKLRGLVLSRTLR
eukprot:TRINITY_DN894_c0_g1_i1.p2 TRINITY_DN894_c0_g1~~TRINITY_DN894_c0_g1_i1.p2  ORF type:complete len:124 (+),score=22.03 TRINITY_DN894_c0_g1_i1:294-665(+)